MFDRNLIRNILVRNTAKTRTTGGLARGGWIVYGNISDVDVLIEMETARDGLAKNKNLL